MTIPKNGDAAYIGLEDMENEATRKFVKEANKFCILAVKDPTKSKRYSDILKVLEADERIPFVTKMGTDANGNEELYNLWKDAKVRWVLSVLPRVS